MIWKDIKKDKPPENEEILFMTGDKEIHLGELFIDQEFKFYCYAIRDFYYCKQGTPIEVRVLYWLPIPQKPGIYKRYTTPAKKYAECMGEYKRNKDGTYPKLESCIDGKQK